MRSRFNKVVDQHNPERLKFMDELTTFVSEIRDSHAAQRLRRILDSMGNSDYEMITENINPCDESGYESLITRLAANGFIDPEIVSKYTSVLKIVSKSESNVLWSDIKQHGISDTIVMSEENSIKFSNLYDHSIGDGYEYIPSDIFFAGTVPIKRCRLECFNDEFTVTADIIIFDDYLDRIKNTDGDHNIVVGVIRDYQFPQIDVCYPIIINRGLNQCVFDYASVSNHNNKRRVRPCMTKNMAYNFIFGALGTWYGIQIALLHPEIRTVMSNRYGIRPNDMGTSTASKTSNPRNTEYVKMYRIVDDLDLQKHMSINKGSFVRKTMAWYVIGHWRHYINGKQVFIQGYWKGEMRDLKCNLDKGRNRIVRPKNITKHNIENTD